MPASAPSGPVCDVALRADLHSRLVAASDPSYQEYLSRYLRSDAVLGVRVPAIRSATNEWASAHGLGSVDAGEAKLVALRLFEMDSAEEKVAASMFLQAVGKRGIVGVDDLPTLAKLFDDGYLSGWAETDSFCSRVLKGIVERGGSEAVEGIARWREAECLWRARGSVVGLLSTVKKEEGRVVVLRCCEVLIRREERFAKTAVGWAMREMAKLDKEIVLDFVERHKAFFSLESVRNATKHYTDEQKKRYVAMVKEAGSGRVR